MITVFQQIISWIFRPIVHFFASQQATHHVATSTVSHHHYTPQRHSFWRLFWWF
ncbi:hypothetical protein ACFQH1_09700 [Lactiplantibacillus daoliensis]|uniref:Uncharacterized protein n=1 Tax=Lactiplantibacillus daoliensis TaxID=2559916 RepID=A0ABW1UKH3_9LACO|nr:hypothetical protein [Lactiplantibacillus daoliensis]